MVVTERLDLSGKLRKPHIVKDGKGFWKAYYCGHKDYGYGLSPSDALHALYSILRINIPY